MLCPRPGTHPGLREGLGRRGEGPCGARGSVEVGCVDVSPMSFPIGAGVVVLTLGNKRGVVASAGRNGRYQVRVEGVTMWCREDDLAVPPQPRKNPKASTS